MDTADRRAFDEGALGDEIAAIRWYLLTLQGVELSAGALVGVVQRAATRAGPAVEVLRDAIRTSPVVHADETDPRENGRNGYVWTFSTPTPRSFTRGSRGKTVLESPGPAIGAQPTCSTPSMSRSAPRGQGAGGRI